MDDVFNCPEESRFYSHCLRALVLERCPRRSTLIEFGSGDGAPVIDSLRTAHFDGAVHGFEISGAACRRARAGISAHSLHGTYVVHHRSFFDHDVADAYCLLSNPPYLPAPDADLRLPALWGGVDGAAATKALLSQGYEQALLIISSYSDPAGVLKHARAQGYCVVDFRVQSLVFGAYSTEPKVRRQIARLRNQGRAFYVGDHYRLAGVLLLQRRWGVVDRSAELLAWLRIGSTQKHRFCA